MSVIFGAVACVVLLTFFTLGYNAGIEKVEIEDWSIDMSPVGFKGYQGGITDVRIENNQLKIYDGDFLILQKNLEFVRRLKR